MMWQFAFMCLEEQKTSQIHIIPQKMNCLALVKTGEEKNLSVDH